MNGPFQFRIVERLTENPKDVLPAFWLKFINSKFHNNENKHEEVVIFFYFFLFIFYFLLLFFFFFTFFIF